MKCSFNAIIIYIYNCWKKSKLKSYVRPWLPPWRKGRITCLWIKSVFDCLTIGIIHETMVVHMTWVWTFFSNYSNHPRMCVLSTLSGNFDKHSPFDIYIYCYWKNPTQINDLSWTLSITVVIIRACACWALDVATLTSSPFLYIYIYIT